MRASFYFLLTKRLYTRDIYIKYKSSKWSTKPCDYYETNDSLFCSFS